MDRSLGNQTSFKARFRRLGSTAILSALSALAMGAALLTLFPGLKISGFAQATARLASLFLGTPVVRVAEGWMLPSHYEPVVVSAACSGTDFWLMSLLLLGWQLGRTSQSKLKTLICVLLGATPFSIAVNAVRVIAVTQAHRWFIPLWPENYATFFHQSTGVAVFLPALIFLHAILEHNRTDHTRRSL